MSELLTVFIDGIEVKVPKGTTILEAAKKAGKFIPTLCYHEDLKPNGICGICAVEVEGISAYKRACCTEVEDGLRIRTMSPELREFRKTVLQLLLSNHKVECPSCPASASCELQELAKNMGINLEELPVILEEKPIDTSSLAIVRNPNKCIGCGRCVTVCQEVQTVYALTPINRGFDMKIGTFMDAGLGDTVCVNCGQCTVYCPTGALVEKSEIEEVWEALMDPNKHVAVQIAPSIRVSVADAFGMEVGKVTIGKIYAALRRLGFDAVFDTNFSADLTIVEEATEIVERVKKGGPLPCITSCSPGWIKFMETYFPGLANYVSSCKSPQQMMGAVIKTYYAKEAGIDPSKIVSVSIMPCTAKKFEARRPEMNASGYRDVDYVLTTREFVRMIKEAGIDFADLPEEEPDEILGIYTGAGAIFGATGGVMEAALRTVYWLLTGKNLTPADIKEVRGIEGIKESVIDIDGLKIKVAVAHGLGNARKLLTKVWEELKTTGKSEYTAIEIMACTGGCVGGGGQFFGNSVQRRIALAQSLYQHDKSLPYRYSHENPAIKRLYERYLGHFGSELAHKLLHTYYYERDIFGGKVVRQLTKAHH